MVQLQLRLTATPDRAQHLLEALQAVLRRDRLHAACCGGFIAADVNDPAAVWFVEDWEDRAALDRQLASQQFAQLLELMEATSTPPHLEFRFVDERRGLDYVDAVRRADDAFPR